MFSFVPFFLLPSLKKECKNTIKYLFYKVLLFLLSGPKNSATIT
ncbi:Hypothetical protein I595_3448 [Croceitalea dokdonensis DOKDO 023]|uniref:Uncharacterized protein n=1 Tax=Croceitalea dokdonensis DOKDO 023 TaxID=1300341 RepID=A0A0P7A1W7_9FLAO|nr:Hypothetical protein I595_3448 [Croceitalea dokdonensis DOKDO 023]